jgi:hypothetical protein
MTILYQNILTIFIKNNIVKTTIYFSYLLFGLLILTTLPGNAQNPEVIINDVTADPGAISVPVDMLSFTEEVNSFTFIIAIDTLQLEFIEITNIEGFSQNIIANVDDATLFIVWYDVNGYQPDGHVFDLVFDYTGTANTVLAFEEGENEVTHEVTPIPDIEYTDGLITTTEPLPDSSVELSTITTAPGEISIPLTMNNFQSLVQSFEMHITIENGSLAFIQLDNLTEGLQQGTLTSNQQGDVLNITWNTEGNGFLPAADIFDLN